MDDFGLYELMQRERARLASQPTEPMTRSLGIAAAAAEPSPYAGRAIGIDISHYQAEIDWDKCDADFVIIKAGEGTEPDPLVTKHVQDAYDHHIPIGLYWFHDPAMFQNAGFAIDPDTWWSPAKDPQLQAIIRTCGTKAFNFLMFDHERWWLFYNEYFEYLNGARKIEDVKKVTNAWNSISAKIEMGRIYDWMRATWPSKDNPAASSKILSYYSANWFINSFCPDAKAWIDKYEQIPAEYPYNATRVPIANLAEYREKYLPTAEQKPKWLGNRPWFIWQASGDKFTVPWVRGATGQPSAIDIDISYLPREQFLKAIGAEVTTPEPPPDNPPDNPPDDGELPPVTGDLKETNELLRQILIELQRQGSFTYTITTSSTNNG